VGYIELEVILVIHALLRLECCTDFVATLFSITGDVQVLRHETVARSVKISETLC
jgi:hypothetical protein